MNSIKEINSNLFISPDHETLFYLINNDRHQFDDELGITKLHYLDSNLAKEWYDYMIRYVHPTVTPPINTLLSSRSVIQPNSSIRSTMVLNVIPYGELELCISKLYNQMIGNV